MSKAKFKLTVVPMYPGLFAVVDKPLGKGEKLAWNDDEGWRIVSKDGNDIGMYSGDVYTPEGVGTADEARSLIKDGRLDI